MRPIWKGQISFGLINIPIELYSAEKPREIKFNLLDNRNKATVHYERVNDETGEEVPWSEVVKAYKYNKNDYIVMEEADFKRAAIENTQTYEIEDFVERKSLNCMYFEKPYFLVPTKGAQKGYVLLREILKKTDRGAIGKVVIRTRQYLAVLLPIDNILVLNTMRFAAEIKDPAGLSIPTGTVKDYKISTKELEMAEKLLDSMTVKWKPEKYHDDYSESLINWIEKKAKHGHIPAPSKSKEKKESGENVIDFIQLLKKSLKKEPKAKSSLIKNKRTTTKKVGKRLMR